MDRFKNSPLAQLLYSIPGLVPTYHFLLSLLGAALYRNLSKKIFIVGVTGTKGKTTTLELISTILEAAWQKTALLTSLRIKVADESVKNKTENSMPGRFFIQKFLRRAIDKGCTCALIEVTSQGVVYSRHRFVNWNAAILTNLAPEHIEAHGTFEKYRAAKLKFLKYVVAKGGKIFLNREDRYFDFFNDALSSPRTFSFSQKDPEITNLFVKLSSFSMEGNKGQRFFIGDFNRSNIAAAVAFAKQAKADDKTIEGALRSFPGVPGRMEFVQEKPFAVIVDYAHTVESLESVYRALRGLITNDQRQTTDSDSGHQSSVVSRKLICVLGAAGGGRDKWKRPAMGKVAAEYCDKTVLTNEDPYDETPEDITDQIASGFSRRPGASYREINFETILDRREAIKKAIGLARAGDTVVITGKGSEDFIHIKDGGKIPWNEKSVVEEILKEKR
jgi:UDP-N-acetylmuramoyl-L-alanyl-D-glutamate--2,6-diaminopimelate ligase